jgi:hypothetical protein
MQATIKLFKNLPDSKEYSVGVVSRLGDKTFHAHDANGVDHFMRMCPGEYAVDFRHDSIPTNDGMVLAVEGMIRPVPINTASGNVTFDYRIHIKWVSPSKVGTRTELDGSFTDAGGYRYFASTRAATEWIFSYLIPVIRKSNDYLATSEAIGRADREMQNNMMARLYAAANGDNYGPEYDVASVSSGPDTWWASLSETERYRIFQQNGGEK